MIMENMRKFEKAWIEFRIWLEKEHEIKEIYSSLKGSIFTYDSMDSGGMCKR